MTDLATALQNKISVLEDEKEELEDALDRIECKLETYAELLADETGEDAHAPTPSKKKARGRGRPKGSKNKKTSAKSKASNAPKDALWEQAESTLPEGSSGSTIEEQQKAIRRFNPTPRTPPNYGVKAGKPEDVLGDQDHKKANVNVTVEDE
jgi:hypothetical protein